MITKVEIVFENCDSLELENKDIYNISADNIIESAFASNLFQHHTLFEEAHRSHKLFYHHNWDDSHFHVLKIAKDVHISIYKDALKDKKTVDGYDALERLKFGDITQLFICTKEPKKTLLVPKLLRPFFYTWSIPLTWKKETISIYPIYEEQDKNKLGSPNIYQTITEKMISNYYKDEIIEIAIVEDLEKKKAGNRKTTQKSLGTSTQLENSGKLQSSPTFKNS